MRPTWADPGRPFPADGVIDVKTPPCRCSNLHVCIIQRRRERWKTGSNLVKCRATAETRLK